MKAILLAAGVGSRLGEHGDDTPKCLLNFAGQSLLARHFERLRRCGVTEVHVGVGYLAETVEEEIARCAAGLNVTTTLNPQYRHGNIITVASMAEQLRDGSSVLLMDADVLCDTRMLQRLVESVHGTCVLVDQGFVPGDEPVKVSVHGKDIVDFGKQVPADLKFDVQGESVGFFKLSGDAARDLAARCDDYLARGLIEEHYEAPLREAMLDPHGPQFGYEDVTGLPWIEIDFPDDVRRAREEILIQLDGE
jgi:choline kinase